MGVFRFHILFTHYLPMHKKSVLVNHYSSRMFLLNYFAFIWLFGYKISLLQSIEVFYEGLPIAIFLLCQRWERMGTSYRQKQSSRGVFTKMCSEITQQIYKRTPILLCNFIENKLRYGCSRVNLLDIFRTPFYKNTSGGLLLYKNIPKATIRRCS